MSVRGLSSAHRQPLIETVFAHDPLVWTERSYRWPWFIRLPLIAVLSGAAWFCVFCLLFEIAALVNR